MRRRKSGSTKTNVYLVANLLFLVAVVATRQFLKDDYGVSVAFVRWLPSEAQNITYVDVPLTARIAEFEIDQQAFEEWCKRANRPLRKLGDHEYKRVGRCLDLLEQCGGTAAAIKPKPSRRIDRFSKSLTAGDLYYEEHWSNGAGYSIGYDVEEGKGYYSYTPH